MNLLVLSQYYPRNGSHSGVFIHNQNINLVSHGINVTAVVPTPWSPEVLWFNKKWREFGQLPDKTNFGGIDVYYKRYPFLKPAKAFYRINAQMLYRAAYRFLKEKLTFENFDLILARPLIPTGYSACLLAKKLNIPVVCEATGSDVNVYPYYNRTSKRMFRQVIKNADRIIANAENLASEINKYEGNTVCEVTYRGVNIKMFKPLKSKSHARQLLGIEENAKILLFVGALSGKKGIYDLLKAFRMTVDEFPDARLYIIGELFLDTDIRKVIIDYNVEDRACYVGSKPHSELAPWYNACDFLVLPSYSEGLPNVILEAMACGRPVVATPVGGISEVIIDKVCGLLVQVGGIKELADAMGRLMANDALTEAMGKAALRRINNKFVDTEQIKKLVMLLKSVLEERY